MLTAHALWLPVRRYKHPYEGMWLVPLASLTGWLPFFLPRGMSRSLILTRRLVDHGYASLLRKG